MRIACLTITCICKSGLLILPAYENKSCCYDLHMGISQITVTCIWASVLLLLPVHGNQFCCYYMHMRISHVTATCYGNQFCYYCITCIWESAMLYIWKSLALLLPAYGNQLCCYSVHMKINVCYYFHMVINCVNCYLHMGISSDAVTCIWKSHVAITHMWTSRVAITCIGE
jgi:hypothetical protein